MSPVTPPNTPHRFVAGQRSEATLGQQALAGIVGATLNAAFPGAGQFLGAAMGMAQPRGRTATRGNSKRSRSNSRYTRFGSRKRSGSRSGKRVRFGKRTKRRSVSKRSYSNNPSVLKKKISAVGHSLVHEYGGKINDGYVVTVGHSTHSWKPMMRTFLGALLKVLLNRVGYIHTTPEMIMPNVSSGDIVALYYRPSYDDYAGIESSIQYTFGVGESYQSILTGLCTAMQTAITNVLGGRNTQWSVTSIVYAPDGTNDGTRVQIPLIGAMYTFYCESTLTIQNLTANETTDAEITDVDALPVKGYSYAGNGSGAVSRVTNQLTSIIRNNLVADRDGLINLVHGYVSDSMKEPYTKNMYAGVKEFKPVAIQSGGILADTQVYVKTMSIDRFIKEMLSIQYDGIEANGGTRAQKTNLGKFKFYALEKYIEATPQGTPPTVNVSVAYELNHTSCGMIKLKKAKYTVREAYIQTSIPVWNSVTPV